MARLNMRYPAPLSQLGVQQRCQRMHPSRPALALAFLPRLLTRGGLAQPLRHSAQAAVHRRSSRCRGLACLYGSPRSLFSGQAQLWTQWVTGQCAARLSHCSLRCLPTRLGRYSVVQSAACMREHLSRKERGNRGETAPASGLASAEGSAGCVLQYPAGVCCLTANLES